VAWSIPDSIPLRAGIPLQLPRNASLPAVSSGSPIMRLLTYDRGGARRLGAWVGGTVVDLPDAVGHPAFPTTMEALIALHGGTTLEAARDALSNPRYVKEFRVRSPRLLPPIVPISLLEHRWILGPEDRLPWPPGADEVDYQVEVACIVGQFCRGLSADEASGVIFGYTLMNDWVARRSGPGSRRARRQQVDRFATSLGPLVVTPDEFDPAAGRLVARVDGEVWSEGDLGSPPNRTCTRVTSWAQAPSWGAAPQTSDSRCDPDRRSSWRPKAWARFATESGSQRRALSLSPRRGSQRSARTCAPVFGWFSR
jgi:hypothetical protein